MLQHVSRELHYPFIMWMIKGGYEVKISNAKFVSAKRGDKVFKMFLHDGGLNTHGVDRFYLFCKQWLSQDKSFIDNLVLEANVYKRIPMFKLNMVNVP